MDVDGDDACRPNLHQFSPSRTLWTQYQLTKIEIGREREASPHRK